MACLTEARLLAPLKGATCLQARCDDVALTRATGRFSFTVDSALFRELGERLVGRPQIAVAELVKNAYDADATHVVIAASPDGLQIRDNGSGMDKGAFESYWMRIGSPHKQRQDRSPRLKRPLTGSKGIGRLSAQFLGSKIEVRTVAARDPATELCARVDWDLAVKAGDVTQATADFFESAPETTFPDGSVHGTVVTIHDLNQVWTADLFETLARHIWTLQSPLPPDASDASTDFRVDLETPDPNAHQAFVRQMVAVLDLWSARVRARLLPDTGGERTTQWPTRTCRVDLAFADGERHVETFAIPDCAIDTAEVDIRIFDFVGRQPRGVTVDEARDYIRRFGGVHVYDAGFNLPYYGGDTDWLFVERDHANRLSRSELLPEELQVRDGLNDLPTNRRILGAVHVDTSHERRVAARRGGEQAVRQSLQIQISRDRLVDNLALGNLYTIARWPLDYYATRHAAKKLKEAERQRPRQPLEVEAPSLLTIIDQHQPDMRPAAFSAVRRAAAGLVHSVAAESDIRRRQAGLLGALATAGISAMAYEHEIGKELGLLEEVTHQLRDPLTTRESLSQIADELDEWIGRARAARKLFGPLMKDEDRRTARRFNARHVVSDVANEVAPLMRGATISTTGVDARLQLPPGALPEWHAIFQNIFLNAANAMLEAQWRRIEVSSAEQGKSREVIVQDTGYGIDLLDWERFFEPFERATPVTPDRQELGVGGTGLGLTIVRMIARDLGCSVGFRQPSERFATSFWIGWRVP